MTDLLTGNFIRTRGKLPVFLDKCGIKIKSGKRIEDLERRFVGFLPQQIFEILLLAIKDCVA